MSSSNLIVAENQLPGTPQSIWDVPNPSSNIEGFTTDISVNHGNNVDFKINTTSSNYRIEIYRLGYYGGDGARLVATLEHNSNKATVQPSPLKNPSTGLLDAGNWQVTDSWNIPADAVSGVYVAKLVRQDGVAGENQIPFIVRDDGSKSDIVFQTSDTTWQAYNTWGGPSLYDGASVAVSYNRPIITRTDTPWNSVFGVEYSAIRWLEENGYDVSYIAGVDTARNGAQLLDHRAFLSVGHDEYWSGDQRANVEAARDAGVNLAFLSGNEVYWKTQWQPSMDASNTAYRTLVTYKETQYGRTNPSGVWTGTWADPNSPGGGDPQNGLTGTIFTVNSGDPLGTIQIPYEFANLRFWSNTSIANLQPGQTASLIPNYLGYEWDEDLNNGFRPAGLIDLSSTTLPVSNQLQDFGTTNYAPGTATHNLTLYRAPSGALVFGAGTIFWSWGLDSHHDAGPGGVSAPSDPNVQQAMVNLFADMGVQPGTLQSGLAPATQSNDHTPPLSAIVRVDYSAYDATRTITVIGSSTDLGGGIVANVEVSSDGGATWERANGSTNWTSDWKGPTSDNTNGIATGLFEVRAVDDSLNLEAVKQFNVDVVGFAGYLSFNSDVAAAGVDPLAHYDLYGWTEGRDAAFDFDTQLYLLHNPDVKAAGVDPLIHYLQYGRNEGRENFPAIGNTIDANGFDEEYYLLKYPDVAASGMDPYQHYLQIGWREGYDPNAYFDTNAYLAQNPDVAAAGVDPLNHYDLFGWKEGRNPSAQFNTDAYETANPDVAAAQVDPLRHYLQYGALEGRSPQGSSQIA